MPLWMEYRDRWLKKGYNIHAYHGFKAGPLPGCNAMYGDIQCGSSVDEHCHCGTGNHTALDAASPTQAPARGEE
jgi:hypothetical protein